MKIESIGRIFTTLLAQAGCTKTRLRSLERRLQTAGFGWPKASWKDFSGPWTSINLSDFLNSTKVSIFIHSYISELSISGDTIDKRISIKNFQGPFLQTTNATSLPSPTYIFGFIIGREESFISSTNCVLICIQL